MDLEFEQAIWAQTVPIASIVRALCDIDRDVLDDLDAKKIDSIWEIIEPRIRANLRFDRRYPECSIDTSTPDHFIRSLQHLHHTRARARENVGDSYWQMPALDRRDFMRHFQTIPLPSRADSVLRSWMRTLSAMFSIRMLSGEALRWTSFWLGISEGTLRRALYAVGNESVRAAQVVSGRDESPPLLTLSGWRFPVTTNVLSIDLQRQCDTQYEALILYALNQIGRGHLARVVHDPDWHNLFDAIRSLVGSLKQFRDQESETQSLQERVIERTRCEFAFLRFVSAWTVLQNDVWTEHQTLRLALLQVAVLTERLNAREPYRRSVREIYEDDEIAQQAHSFHRTLDFARSTIGCGCRVRGPLNERLCSTLGALATTCDCFCHEP